MALDYRQNFISTQYLENELKALDHMLHIYALMLARSRLELLHLNFCKLTTVLWPLIISVFLLCILRTN